MSLSQTTASLAIVAAILVVVWMLARRWQGKSQEGLLRYILPLMLASLVAIVFVRGIQVRQAEHDQRTQVAAGEPNTSERVDMPAPAHEHAGAADTVVANGRHETMPDSGADRGAMGGDRGLDRAGDETAEGGGVNTTAADTGPATEPSSVPPAGPDAPPLTRSLAPERAPPPPPPPPAAADADAADGRYSVVPVFFGTDRKSLPGAARITYNADRGRRLELGRALVSVPAAHEVPEIERPWSIRIPYFDVKIYEEKEDPAKHFTLREIKTLSREELLALVRERLSNSDTFASHALVFVHGFNTSFDNALYRTAQITHDLKFDGATFLYSWPSGGAVASYTYDRESSGQSEPYMREFLDMVVRESGAAAVSIIAHSMGNQPLLQVLKDLKARTPSVAIKELILAAPDVDRDNFENLAREIRGLAQGITLYAAANDRALDVSRRFHGGIPRAGDVPPSGPVVTEGVDTIDVTAVSTDGLGLNHSGYAENNALLNDIALLLKSGERPPDKRVPSLARIPTPKGDYWRYPRP